MFFSLSEWVSEGEMTDKEKKDYPSYTTTWGYLKTYSYKEAAIKSWKNTTLKDRKLTLKLPNFDDKVFKDIFGFSAIDNIN